jgi:2-polyprenyl-6-methoxyphenol hydroxylase-like FAD-dependent oxidoreductase
MALNIGIVGAGIGGLMAAIAFRKREHPVHLFERTMALAEVGPAVSLRHNALAALGCLGLEETVRDQGQWEEDGALRKPSGTSFWTFNNSNPIIRPALQQVLLDWLRDLPLSLGNRCAGDISPSTKPKIASMIGRLTSSTS